MLALAHCCSPPFVWQVFGTVWDATSCIELFDCIGAGFAVRSGTERRFSGTVFVIVAVVVTEVDS